jgi:hypothetical protein
MNFTRDQRLGSNTIFPMQVKDGAWTQLKKID